MAGPFTNKWDNTFPPDTEFADLYASNLRDFRTDIQQRMASISGLDADKANLNFWDDDTTPPTGAAAKWDGILFFATDTGNIYQFQYNSANNPPSGTPANNWVNITSLFTTQILKYNTVKTVNYIAPTPPAQPPFQSIAALTFPPLTPNQRVRITVNYVEVAPTPGGAAGLIVNISNQPTIMVRDIVQANSPMAHTVIIEGGNFGATNSQYWVYLDIGVPGITLPATNTTFQTANGGFFEFAWQGGHPGQSATFYGITVELM